MFRLALVALLLAAVVPAIAYDDPADSFTPDAPDGEVRRNVLRLRYQHGAVLATNDFFTGENKTGEDIDRFHATSLEWGWQTDGSRLYHHIYNYPSFGIGLYGADFYNDDEIGQPTALYGWFTWPIKRYSGPWRLEANLGFGLTSNWQGYDYDTNPHNVAIAAGRTVYIDAGMQIAWEMAPAWDLAFNVSFTHFSNGGTRAPNSGINTLAPALYLGWKPNNPRPKAARTAIPEYKDNSEQLVSAAYGYRDVGYQVPTSENPDQILNSGYNIVTLGWQYLRQVSYMSKWTGGVNLNYDESNTAYQDPETFLPAHHSTDLIDRLTVAVFGGYEHVVHNTSLQVHLGWTILRTEYEDQLTPFFQRLGLKQHIGEHVLAGVNVRFHQFSRADNLELFAGWRWR